MFAVVFHERGLDMCTEKRGKRQPKRLAEQAKSSNEAPPKPQPVLTPQKAKELDRFMCGMNPGC
jgi:hypothetical protein